MTRLFWFDMIRIHATEDVTMTDELLEWREICVHFKNFTVQSSVSSLFHSSLTQSREYNAGADELAGIESLVACISCLTNAAMTANAPKGIPVTLEMYLTQSLQDENQDSADKVFSISFTQLLPLTHVLYRK